MKISFSKEELYNRLQDVYHISSGDSDYFLLDASSDRPFVFATDLHLSLREPVNAVVQEPGKVCIPVKKLLKIAKEFDGDIALASEGSKWIVGSSGKSKFKLTCLPVENFPTWPEIDSKGEIVFNSTDLAEMIEKTIYATGETDERYALKGLLFHIEPGNLVNIVATDSYRLALASKEVEHNITEEKKLIIAKNAAKTLRKLILHYSPENIVMKVGSNQVLFKVAESDFVVTLVDGSYPDYRKVLPADNGNLILEREKFLQVLKRVAVMSNKNNKTLKFNISEKLMVVSSEDPTFGNLQDELDINYKGDPFIVGFNSRFLIEALSAIKSNTISFSVYGPFSASLLTEPGQNSYKCVIMPTRL